MNDDNEKIPLLQSPKSPVHSTFKYTYYKSLEHEEFETNNSLFEERYEDKWINDRLEDPQFTQIIEEEVKFPYITTYIVREAEIAMRLCEWLVRKLLTTSQIGYCIGDSVSTLKIKLSSLIYIQC
jgi:hypothetical protein